MEEEVDARMKTPSKGVVQENLRRDLRWRTSAKVLLERRMDMA
jgi:hypothetical protein